MHQLLMSARSKRGRRGFTLVELLVVIVVLAVLAAIVLPKFMDSGKRSKEAAMRGDLKLLRNAVTLFQADTGCYPKSLADLAETNVDNVKAIDSSGADQAFVKSDWHGPYIQEVPKDPITGGDFGYSTTAPVGKVKSAATGNAMDGTAYSSW